MYFNDKTAEELTLVATLKAKEGQSQDLLSLLESIIEPTRAEDGCLSYHLYRDIDDPNVFIFHEIWRNESVWLKHMEEPHLTSMFETATPLFAQDPILKKYERSDAPGPRSEKGMLVLFAANHAIKGVEQKWQAILESLIAPTMDEDGAIHYELHKDREDPQTFLFHETWATVPAWEAHMKTPHLIGLLDIINDYAEGGIELVRAEIID